MSGDMSVYVDARQKMRYLGYFLHKRSYLHSKTKYKNSVCLKQPWHIGLAFGKKIYLAGGPNLWENDSQNGLKWHFFQLQPPVT